jgi:hypothetical protein
MVRLGQLIEEWRPQMRKLILIAVIATMSTTSCYANLSLASNDPSPVATEPQPSPTVTEPQESPTVTEPQQSKSPQARPATVAKTPNVAKHHRSHVSGWATPVRGFYQHCM